MRRSDRQTLLAAIAEIEWFRGIPVIDLEPLADAMQRRDVPAGTVIVGRDEPVCEFSLLTAGRAAVRLRDETSAAAVLHAPQWVGDLAWLSRDASPESVVAETACTLWTLPRTHFMTWAAQHPALLWHVVGGVARRLRVSEREVAAQAVLATERTALLADLRQRTDELSALAHIAQAVGASLELDRTLASISTYAAHLTHSDSALIFLYDQEADVLSVRASHNAPAGYLAEVGERRIPAGPVAPTALAGRSLTVRACVERAPVQIADVEAATSYVSRDLLLRWGYRAVLVVPLLVGERMLGAMSVLRRHAGAFGPRETQLVTAFAGHSAIALAHARLFQEVQGQNEALREALDRQTVTSDFLQGISETTFELQPVLQALVEHATRLCGAASGFIFTRQEGGYRVAADHGAPEEFRQLLREHPIPPERRYLVGRTALEGRPIHIPDILADPDYAWSAGQRLGRYRSVLGVPLLQAGQPIGVIVIYRTQVLPFRPAQIEMLTSFAHHAVVAIEKVRLFHEVRARTEALARSVNELRALSQTTRAVNSSLELEQVLAAIAEQACRLCDGDAGLITELVEESGEVRPCATWNVPARLVQDLVLTSPPTGARGATRQDAALGNPVQIADILVAEEYPWREPLAREGYRAILSVPLLRGGRVTGTIAVARVTPGAFREAHVRLLTTFADQAAIALEHARLYRQLQQKAAQLEVVSQHKSRFLASMSHELRTPLNAIIGFSEVLLDASLGPLSDAERQEFLTNILTAGRHLLRLINDVLELSKIEAGKLEVSPQAVWLGDVIPAVLATVEPLADKARVILSAAVPEDLPAVCADPSRLRQILLNLLGNAIKFTPAGGHVRVRASARSSPGEGLEAAHVAIAVEDTGIGIPAEHLSRIFEEFQQGPDAREGTGLGLTLVKRLVEQHGGTVTVASTPGQGSTFTFTLPVAKPMDGTTHEREAHPDRRG